MANPQEVPKYFGQIFLNTAWKWKKLGRGGGGATCQKSVDSPLGIIGSGGKNSPIQPLFTNQSELCTFHAGRIIGSSGSTPSWGAGYLSRTGKYFLQNRLEVCECFSFPNCVLCVQYWPIAGRGCGVQSWQIRFDRGVTLIQLVYPGEWKVLTQRTYRRQP